MKLNYFVKYEGGNASRVYFFVPIRKKYKLFMKLLLLCLISVQTAYGQQEIFINLKTKDEPIEKVISKIRKQSGYDFIFNMASLASASTVTVNLTKVPLKDALDAIFKNQPLSYEMGDTQITIIPKRTKRQQQSNIEPQASVISAHGYVTDTANHTLQSVTVRDSNTGRTAVTDASGHFMITGIEEGGLLTFRLLGYKSQQVNATSQSVYIRMEESIGELEAAEVTVNTGYQSIPKERATGSFVVLDSALINRRVSTNIIDRLDGVTSGVYFNGLSDLDIPSQLPGDRLGINIRGESSFLSAKDPLVVLDNFPYSGEIKNINPNDIASITILKDAAAASIWGARAGNGVIVITTKKGSLNTKMEISFSSNLTIVSKPDLYNLKNVLTTPQYIEVEKYLFDQGLFNQDLLNLRTQAPVSPVVEILDRHRSGLISEAEAENQIDYYRNIDVRDDFNKYVYQKGIKQQYNLALRGGTNNLSYSLSAGLDHNRDQIRRNGYSRKTLNTYNTYSPIKNLEISFGLNYSNNTTELNNTRNTYGSSLYSVGGRYNKMLPYSRLADEQGNALPITKGFKSTYIDELISKGYKDWYYRPLDEIANGNNQIGITNILFRSGLKYRFTNFLNAEIQYANEFQEHKNPTIQNQNTYYARNLMNRYAQQNPETGIISYIFPEGGVYSESNANWRNNNFRGQLNFDNTYGDHYLSALAGFEIREQKVSSSQLMLYGYDDQFGTSIGNLDFVNFYPTLPAGSSTLPLPTNAMSEMLERYISYYANVSYIYKEKYQITLSGRKDGSNIFGVNTNKKVTPLASVGLGWIVSNEPFFHTDFIPYLKLRGSYGYNGNLRNTSAYLSGMYFSNPLTGFRYISVFTPPNPDLRWERVRNLNVGVDFALKSNRISGTIEFYSKRGMDLLQNTPLPGQTGFSSFISNAAEMKTKGLDVSLNSINLNRDFKWNTAFLLSRLTDKVLAYDPKPNATIVQGAIPVIGYPLNSVFSYYWEGLDPEDGDPMGRLNGIASKDYASINNNISPDSLKFHGNARPQIFGSIRNDFSYKGISLSFNITYKLDYFIRRSSVSLNYTDLLGLYQHSDYEKRWQKPGDELKTSVPSLAYPSNSRRNTFYKYSEALVEPADHIRLQDIRLGYSLPAQLLKKVAFKRVEIFSYAQNLGIIWRKNKNQIDPDNIGVTGGSLVDVKIPLNLSFGIIADF